MRFRPIHLFASATLLGLWGCPVGNAPGTGDGSASGADSTGAAAVRVLMTDAPVDADNVFVTFCGVRVASGSSSVAAEAGATDQAKATVDASDPAEPEGDSQGGGWISISDECQTIDLLTLQNGITEDVGINALPTGSYGQIRLMLREASIVKDGIKQPLIVPSGTESGIKIVGGFTIVAGQPTTVTIDFDAGRSIHYAPGQGFIMSPVLKVMNVTKHDDGADGRSGSAEAQPGTTEPEHGQGNAGAGGSGGSGSSWC